MKLRLFFFNLAFRRPHQARNLGNTFPVTNLPVCYAKEQYNSDLVKELKYHHIVVSRSEYIYWYQDGDHQAHWESLETTGIDEFILLYHKNKISRQYPLIITQLLYGSYMEFAKSGRLEEYEKKRLSVQNMISFSLKNYLKSYKHKFIKFMLKISN